MKKYVALLLAACALSATADDFVLRDGSVLQDASVVRSSLDSVIVRHSNGVQKLLFDRLSPQLQQQLGMTPELVAERRAAALHGAAEVELTNLRAAQQAQREAENLRTQVEHLQQQNEALRKQLADARAVTPATSTTVVVDNPVYVPVPTPVGRPCPPPPPPHRRPVVDPRRSRPVIHSNHPRPASSAHTLPRR